MALSFYVHQTYACCYALNVYAPHHPNSCVEALSPKAMLFEAGPLEVRWYEIKKAGPSWWDLCPSKKRHRRAWALSLPREDTVRKQPSADQDPTTLAGTLIWDSEPPEQWEDQFSCLSHSFYGILLQQPKLTKTHHALGLWRRSPCQLWDNMLYLCCPSCFCDEAPAIGLLSGWGVGFHKCTLFPRPRASKVVPCHCGQGNIQHWYTVIL